MIARSSSLSAAEVKVIVFVVPFCITSSFVNNIPLRYTSTCPESNVKALPCLSFPVNAVCPESALKKNLWVPAPTTNLSFVVSDPWVTITSSSALSNPWAIVILLAEALAVKSSLRSLIPFK